MLYILLGIIFVLLATAAYGGQSATIWVPMAKGDAERAVTLAGVQSGDRVYDLGCGDARVLTAAAALGANATGFEVSLIPYAIGKLRCMCSPYREHAQIYYANFWKQDISDARVVFIYLIPGVYEKIMNKITRECKAGTVIITYVWPFKDLTEDAVSELKDHPNIWKYTL